MTSTQRNINCWRAFALLAVLYFMTTVDLTNVKVSLPTIGRELHFSPTSLQWVAAAKTTVGDLEPALAPAR